MNRGAYRILGGRALRSPAPAWIASRMPLTGLPDAVDAPDTVVMIMFPPLHGFAVTDVFRVYYATVSGTGPFEAIRLRRWILPANPTR